VRSSTVKSERAREACGTGIQGDSGRDQGGGIALGATIAESRRLVMRWTLDLSLQATHSIFRLILSANKGREHTEGDWAGPRDALNAWSIELLRRLASSSLMKTEVGPAFVRAKCTARP